MIHFSIYPLLFVLFASLFRLFCYVEVPFVAVINSYAIFPAIKEFFDVALFILPGHVTVNVAAVFMAVWVIGSVSLLLKTLLKHIRFYKMTAPIRQTQEAWIHSMMNRITAQSKPGIKVNIIQTPLVNAPMIIGFFKPSIYLPDIPFSKTEMYNILLHEWNHYIHKDLWIELKNVCGLFQRAYGLRIGNGYS